MSNENKRTATQRLDDLERGIMTMYQTLDAVARDLMVSKEAIKLLNNKIDAIVKASSRGETLSDQIIADIMIENNVEELKSKVTGLVDRGVLVAQEQVDERSFVVGREINNEGKVANPRLQFVMSAMQEPVKGKLLGSKPGDVILIEENKLKFEVLETYLVKQPESPDEAAEAAQAAAEAIEQTEAPVAETGSEQPQA